MKLRTIILWTVALGFAGVLEHANNAPPVNLETGVIYVYFPSSCTAREASTCSPIDIGVRPAFESMDACMAHAGNELDRAGNPLMMASCMKEREV